MTIRAGIGSQAGNRALRLSMREDEARWLREATGDSNPTINWTFKDEGEVFRLTFYPSPRGNKLQYRKPPAGEQRYCDVTWKLSPKQLERLPHIGSAQIIDKSTLPSGQITLVIAKLPPQFRDRTRAAAQELARSRSMNNTITATYEHEKTTPGTHRYKRTGGDDGVATIYINKKSLGDKPAPRSFTMTITPTG